MKSKNEMVVNALPLLSELTGVGRYTLEVCKRLHHEPELRPQYYYGYVSSRLRNTDTEVPGDQAAASLARVKGGLGRNELFRRFSRKCLLLTNRLFGGKFDLYWEPNHVPLPGIRSQYQITTIHDLSTYLHPEWHPAERNRYFRRHFPENIRRSDMLVTVSHAMKSQIEQIEFLRDLPVRVIPNGVDHDLFCPMSEEAVRSFREKFELPQDFILFVGSRADPRKNFRRLREAHSHFLSLASTDIPLVVVGGCWGSGHNKAEENSDKDAPVKSLGYLSREDLALAYNAASVVAYPSLYEGFGLPAIEAMACRTPVVASDIPALREVCGEAACFVEPTSAEAICAGLEKVMTDTSYAEQLVNRGREQAEMYSWHRTADLHMNLFKEVIDK